MLLIGLGIFFVMIGSQLVVKAATQIAYRLHYSQRFIGLTIVAFGTSLPELVTSLQAARKDHAGIAIGNIVGSNIFNILFIIFKIFRPIMCDPNGRKWRRVWKIVFFVKL